MDHSLGSVELDSPPGLDAWNVVVKNARGRHDKRPVKSLCKGTPPCACHRNQGNICSLDREAHGGNICGVEQFTGEWERVPVTLDSGAVDSVIPRRLAKGVPVKQTEASRRGLRYRAANGTAIINEGERSLSGYTNEANRVDMTFQVCEVTKALGSARAMLKAGNRVVLDNEGSYIQNKASGVITKVEDKNGSFVFDIWVPRGSERQGNGYQGKYFQALVEGEEQGNHETGFVGLDDLF